MDAKHRDFLSVMGHLYLTNGKPDRATTVYACLHSEFPDDLEIALALAYAKLQNGDFSEAVSLADEVTQAGHFGKNEPNFDRLIKAKGLWNRGEKKAARREMDAFLATATLREPERQSPATNTKTEGEIAKLIEA